ncbi:protein Som1p, mitochondrial [Diutina catenulata]
MSPPVEVLQRSQVPSRYTECTLKSITQHECTFRAQEIICLPFKRIFERCLVNGKYKNIEVTTRDTNHDIVTEAKYEADVRDFMDADKEFRAMMWKQVTND